MLGDKVRHGLDPPVRLQEYLQIDRPVEDPIQVLDVRNALGLGEVQELALELLTRHEDLVWR